MNSLRRLTAIVELLLVLPASLFMASLFVQHLEPIRPARVAQHLVGWFSAHVFVGLYVFLVALPLVASLVGWGSLLLNWRSAEGIRRTVLDVCAVVRPRFANLLIAGATGVAGAILGIVAIHMMTH